MLLSSKLKPYKKGYKIEGTDIIIRKRPDVKNWEVCIYIKEAQKVKAFSSHTEDLDQAIIFGITKNAELSAQQKYGIEVFSKTFEKVATDWLEHLSIREKQWSQSSSTLRIVESRKCAVALPFGVTPFHFPAHQTGHAGFQHPAFRLASSSRTRRRIFSPV